MDAAGVGAASRYVSSNVCKQCPYSFINTSAHNFLSAPFTPGQGEKDSAFLVSDKMLLRVSWREPLCFFFLHYQIQKSYFPYPICLAFCSICICLLQHFQRITCGVRGNDQRIGTISVWKHIQICIKCFDLMMSNVETGWWQSTYLWKM